MVGGKSRILFDPGKWYSVCPSLASRGKSCLKENSL